MSVSEGCIAGESSGLSGEVIRRMLHGTQFTLRGDVDLVFFCDLTVVPGTDTCLYSHADVCTGVDDRSKTLVDLYKAAFYI